MTRLFTLVLSALVVAACGAPEAPKPQAAAVFESATVYTRWDAEPQAVDVAVDAGGAVLWVGVADALESVVSTEGAARYDLSGAVLYPGFTDSHAHLLGIGQRELSLDLSGIDSIAALVDQVETEVSRLAAGETLVGRGWIETGWPEGRMPTAADLDAASPDNPVLLTRADGHALVANSAALAAVGIDAETADPDGGRIERDAAGAATGLLIDTAMALVAPLVAEPTEPDLIRAYVTGGTTYAARGWTGLHNMSVDPAHAPLMERLSLEGRLPLRIYNAFDESGLDLAAARRHETATITNRAVKIYMDGALGSRGALLSEPYADQPGTSGLALRRAPPTEALMKRAEAAGVQLAIHAIGDLANTRVFDWVEAALADGGRGAGLRWRIEHAQILANEDVPRFAELGVIASMQPSHAIGDLKFAPARLGLDRLAGAYAWRDVLDAGGVIAGGSDAPVEVGSPLIEFYAAVARKDLEGFQGEGWNPDQAVTRAEALRMFTAAPAYAAFQEDVLGEIAPGRLADFTVFDRDLMTIPEAEILDAEPVMTVVGGKVVWTAR
ncbi:MAG: amidohydrolase [Pseudomonadota bacterium]